LNASGTGRRLAGLRIDGKSGNQWIWQVLCILEQRTENGPVGRERERKQAVFTRGNYPQTLTAAHRRPQDRNSLSLVTRAAVPGFEQPVRYSSQDNGAS